MIQFKYLKYKDKYLKLKKQIGGAAATTTATDNYSFWRMYRVPMNHKKYFKPAISLPYTIPIIHPSDYFNFNDSIHRLVQNNEKLKVQLERLREKNKRLIEENEPLTIKINNITFKLLWKSIPDNCCYAEEIKPPLRTNERYMVQFLSTVEEKTFSSSDGAKTFTTTADIEKVLLPNGMETFSISIEIKTYLLPDGTKLFSLPVGTKEFQTIDKLETFLSPDGTKLYSLPDGVKEFKIINEIKTFSSSDGTEEFISSDGTKIVLLKREIKNFTLNAYTSISEFGFWRIATYDPNQSALFLNKYDNYLQSTLLHLDLQKFIWEYFEKIPFVEPINPDGTENACVIPYYNDIDWNTSGIYYSASLKTIINPYGIIYIPNTTLQDIEYIVGTGDNKRCKILPLDDAFILEQIKERRVTELMNIYIIDNDNNKKTVKVSDNNQKYVIYHKNEIGLIKNDKPREPNKKHYLPEYIYDDLNDNHRKLGEDLMYIVGSFNYDYTYELRNLISDYFRVKYNIIHRVEPIAEGADDPFYNQLLGRTTNPLAEEYDLDYKGEIGNMVISNKIQIVTIEEKDKINPMKLNLHVCKSEIKNKSNEVLKAGYCVINIVDADAKINSYGLYDSYYSGTIKIPNSDNYVNYVTKVLNYKSNFNSTNNVDLHDYYNNSVNKMNELQTIKGNTDYIFEGYRNDTIFPIKELIKSSLREDKSEIYSIKYNKMN